MNSITSTTNYLQHQYRRLIHYKAGILIWWLQRGGDLQACERYLNELRQLPIGTVGKTVAMELDELGVQLIPQFENHDLKHALLGYDRTLEGELEMQAFMFGNGNRTLLCLLPLLPSILLPPIWQKLIVAYRRGRKASSIFYLQLDDCKHQSLLELRATYQL